MNSSNTVNPYLSNWARQQTAGVQGMGQNFYDASAAQSIAQANQQAMDYAKALTSQDRKWKYITNLTTSTINGIGNIIGQAVAAKSAETGGKLNYLKFFTK